MEIGEIEKIVGRLYLTVVDQQRQIEELKAQIPKASMPPTIFSLAERRDAEGSPS